MTYPLTTLAHAMLTVAPENRRAVMQAHRAAAEFHENMANALEAEDELSDTDNPDIGYWRAQHDAAIGAAIRALNHMPVKWAMQFSP